MKSKWLALGVLVMFGCNPPGCSETGAMRVVTPPGSECYSGNSRGGTGVCLNGSDLYTCTVENTGCDKYEAKCVLRGRIHEVAEVVR